MLAVSLLAKSAVLKALVATAALSVTGATVGAETGTLPAPIQSLAHDYLGAAGVPAPDDETATEPGPGTSGGPRESPTAEPTDRPTTDPTTDPTDDPSAEPGGPDASGSPAYGLCR